MKKDLQERNSSLLNETESLRYVSSEPLIVLFKPNSNNKMDPSVFREPQEPLEISAESDPQLFASSGYF